MVVQKIPSFDPNPSLKAALEFLKENKIKDFALIGRIATWIFLPADRQQFTKDVDFAILSTETSKIEKALKGKGFKVYQLSIGGVAVREPNFVVDFIDRRLDGFNDLFQEAIANSRKDVKILEETIPVVDLNYLLTMKLVSGEPKDDLDVKALLKVEGLDFPKLRELVKKHLGSATANRLEVFAREVGVLPLKDSYKISGPSE